MKLSSFATNPGLGVCVCVCEWEARAMEGKLRNEFCFRYDYIEVLRPLTWDVSNWVTDFIEFTDLLYVTTQSAVIRREIIIFVFSYKVAVVRPGVARSWKQLNRNSTFYTLNKLKYYI